MNVDEHNKQALRRTKEWERDLKTVLETPEGRRALAAIMDHSNMMASNLFTGNSTTFHNLGRRDEGLWLYNEILSVAPGTLIQMMNDRLIKDQDNG